MTMNAGVIDDIKSLPSEDKLHEEQLSAYETAFTEHKTLWQEILEENAARMNAGTYSLHWMETDGIKWGRKIKPSSRGMTYQDINKSPNSGEVPTMATWKNFTPRGAIREPYRDRFPVVEDYDLTNKHGLWADNVEMLYEEAKARQWNATRDIPWSEVEKLPDDLQKATNQLATFLTEVEFVAGDFPSKWMYRIPQDFLEVKSFLATQIMDEARHQEVFRKRAISGGGLLHASPGFEWALQSIMNAPTHTMGTFLLNLLGEGLVLSIFRSGEMIAKTHVDKEIFRLCLQDEARHVSYGVMQFKNFIDNSPDKEKAIADLHRFADVGEMVILSSFTEAALVEPLAILLGGGLKKIDEGMDGMATLWKMSIEEYLARCERAGFDRREKCRIPTDAPWAN